MFKKKEHGFSLVELSVAAAIATALAVVAVTVVTGTAASVSSKGSSAASVESCTISEALAKSGGDEAASDCVAGGSTGVTYTSAEIMYNNSYKDGNTLYLDPTSVSTASGLMTAINSFTTPGAISISIIGCAGETYDGSIQDVGSDGYNVWLTGDNYNYIQCISSITIG